MSQALEMRAGKTSLQWSGSQMMQSGSQVGESEYGFTMELWGLAPNRYYVDIESPSGQKTGRIQGGLSGQRYVTFFIRKNKADRRILYGRYICRSSSYRYENFKIRHQESGTSTSVTMA